MQKPADPVILSKCAMQFSPKISRRSVLSNHPVFVFREKATVEMVEAS